MLLGTGTQRLLIALDAVAATVIGPVWLAAAVGVVWAAHRRRLAPVLLAGAALTWLAEVVVMSGGVRLRRAGPVPGPGRGGAVRAGRGGGGVDRVGPAAGAVRTGWARPAGRGVPAALPGWPGCRRSWPRPRTGPRYEADLDRTLAALGRDRLVACGLPLGLDTARPAVEFRPALAWKLDVPLAASATRSVNGTGVSFAQRGSPIERNLAAQPPADARPVLRTERWVVYAQRCPTLGRTAPAGRGSGEPAV